MHPSLPTHSLTFQRQNWTHPHRILESDSHDSFPFPPAPPPKLKNFIPVTLTEIITHFCFWKYVNNARLIIHPNFLKLSFSELGSIITNLVNVSIFLEEFCHRHAFKQALVQPLLKNHLYPLMILKTVVQFQTSTSFLKFSKKFLPPAFASLVF